MKLTLLRHGIAEDKYLWKNDRDRMLTNHGREKLLNHLNEHHNDLHDIDIIICSPSIRTRQTCALLCSLIMIDPGWIIYDSRIYSFEGYDDIMDCIREIPHEKRHLCIIGHNDSLSDYASHLLKEHVHLKKWHFIQSILP